MLSGRLACVTGGARGIGLAVSKVLAREGADVAVLDLNAADASEAAKSLGSSGKHVGLAADVSSLSSVKAALKEIRSSFSEKPPSVVVNCAGITRDGYLLKMAEKDFDAVIGVNLKGTFNVNQTFAAAMREAGVKAGSLVNIASVVGQVGNVGQANYSASKAGVIGFTKTAAKELGKFGIRVNCICPGFIYTPMTETVPEHIKQMLLLQIPLGDYGQPEDIAEMCAFLGSDRSKYVTGAILNVNGGLY